MSASLTVQPRVILTAVNLLLGLVSIAALIGIWVGQSLKAFLAREPGASPEIPGVYVLGNGCFRE